MFRRFGLFVMIFLAWLAPVFCGQQTARAMEPAFECWGPGTFEILDWGETRVGDEWGAYFDAVTTFTGMGTVKLDVHDRWSQSIWCDPYWITHRVVNNSSMDWTGYELTIDPGPLEPGYTRDPLVFTELPELISCPFSTVEIGPNRRSIVFSDGLVPHGGDANFFEVKYSIDVPCGIPKVLIDQVPKAGGGTLTSVASGNFNDPTTWDHQTLVPSEKFGVIVRNHSVALETYGDAESLVILNPVGKLTVHEGNVLSIIGGVAVTAGTLEIDGICNASSVAMTDGSLNVAGTLNARSVAVAAGSLDLQGTLRADSVALSDATVGIGRAGVLSVAGGLTMDDVEFTLELDGSSNGLIFASDDVHLSPGNTLSLQAVGSLPTVGETTRTIIAAPGVRGRIGTFTYEPAAGEHLGHGVFFRHTNYGAHTVEVELLQAADGDINGNRQVDGSDVEAILAANKFGDESHARWPEGDFTGDNRCNGDDVQAILAANLLGAGRYSGSALERDGGEERLDLILTPEGLVIDTGTATINGYVLTSADGIFTGASANNLGLFQEDTDTRISGNLGFSLTGPHLLGDVLGDELGMPEAGLLEDLTFTYTVQDQSGVYRALITVPEPGTLAMLCAGAAGLLVYGRRRRNGRHSLKRIS